MSDSSATTKSQPGDNRVVINCEPYMDISDAQSIHRELLNALEKGKDVEIEAAEVERIDTAALQLLYGFISEARVRQVTVRWGRVSEVVQRSADTLGLRQRLGIPG